MVVVSGTVVGGIVVVVVVVGGTVVGATVVAASVVAGSVVAGCVAAAVVAGSVEGGLVVASAVVVAPSDGSLQDTRTIRPAVAKPTTRALTGASVRVAVRRTPSCRDTPVTRPGSTVVAVTSTFSDEELTVLALAADPDAPLGDDAEPWVVDDGRAALLPAWYMPAAVRARPRQRLVVALVIGALVVVNGAGLCVTDGFPEIAW